MAIFSDEKQEAQLEKMREKEEEELAQILSQKYKLPYLNLSAITIEIDALKIVPEEKAREARIAVFQQTGKKISVALMSPNPEPSQNILKFLEQEGYKAKLYLVSENSLKKAWKRYKEVPEFMEVSRGIIDVSPEKLEQFIEEAKTLDNLKNVFSGITESKQMRRVSETFEIILAGAISAEASDIHIEPQENGVRLRFRLDGVLHDILIFEQKIFALLLSRIKLVSGLKLNVRDQAQDGRFSVRIKDSEIEIRTSIIPGSYGENVVMRLLNPKSIGVSFEELGIEERLYKILLNEIKKPNGMLLTTGPTGSGKTTTLYAALKKIHSPEIKIITLENPIEYHLKGVNQTQVDDQRGYGFAEGLRAILRQDPDIIMVGEIRDLETAKIAMNAALTGHFVFSTLHTNNAAGTVPRLIDLGVNPAIIAPSINVAMAQRLVRRLCDKCKEKSPASPEEKEIIRRVLDTFPKDYGAPKIDALELWRGKGCAECNGIGYKKRIGIFEAILIDEKIEKLILKNPSESEIIETSKSQGILNMAQDGVLKVLKGVTSLDELQRVAEL